MRVLLTITGKENPGAMRLATGAMASQLVGPHDIQYQCGIPQS
jgi:predicted amino acid-binding ACT domain protein